MRNITLSVPDAVYRGARIRAAELGTSVSAVVAQYLRSLAEEATDFARREEQQRQIQSQIEHFRGSDRLSRGELHERAVR
jgi:hypothetical protein